MAAIAGRAKRAQGVGPLTKPSTVRLRVTLWDKAERAAEALGVSRDAYLDRYLEREELDERGRPVWWTDPVPADQLTLLELDTQEAPLKSA